MRIVQISDTHPNQDKADFSDNRAPLAAWIAARYPDPRDLYRRLRLSARQPVNAKRLRAWRPHFGPDRWAEDVAEALERSRLIGFDVMLMGSGEPEEDEQALWLKQAMGEAEQRQGSLCRVFRPAERGD